MLLERAPEERLKMGCSMGATARVLVRASVLAQDPHASPAAVRRALFLRFYSHEFSAAEQERILVRLGQDIPFRPNDGVSTKPGELHAPTVAVPLT